ncbi:MAG: GGDEF domain-containing protein [Pseudomonadota bacterium]
MPNTTPTCSTGEPCQLSDEIASLKREIEQLAELVSTDTLTGLNNYRYFAQVIVQEMERSQRTGQATILMMVDADHFKNVNDQWGHETGNQALKLIADCIKNNIRKLDIPCRYGGEEFAIILPSTDITTGIHVAERIRQAVENAVFTVGNKQQHPLTISIGLIAYLGDQYKDWNILVEKADHELYRAKQEGRNQVCYALPDENKDQQVSEDEKSALFDIFKDTSD